MDPVQPAGIRRRTRPSIGRPRNARVIRVLVCIQVLGGVGVSIGLAVSTLAAARMSGSDAIGGSALTCAVIGAAGAAVLVARIAARAGRRPSLTMGYLIGAGGGRSRCWPPSWTGGRCCWPGWCCSAAATAAGLAARFAATDLAAPERRGRALAVVVWATTVGAVAGPNLGEPAQRLAGAIGLAPLAGPFLVCAVVFALAALGTWVGLRPDPLLLARAGGGARSGRRLDRGDHGGARAALRAAPAARLGVAGIVLCHLVMVGVMSMTPVHMGHGGATLQLVGLVISLHVAGMYALSPVFGWLADRVGSAGRARAGRVAAGGRGRGERPGRR